MTHYRRELFRSLEAGLIGLFFVQAMRFLYSALYAHLGSLDQVTKTLNRDVLSGVAGVVARADVQLELGFTVIGLLLPLLAVLFGRSRFGTLAGVLVAAGRVYITANGHSMIGVIGAALAVGGAALYIAILAQRRAHMLPIVFIFGFAGDQLIRLYGYSIDVTWGADFLLIQVIASVALFVILLINIALDIAEQRARDRQSNESNAPPLPPIPRTQISGWGALALGGLLYLEFTLLGLSNTLAHRAGVDSSVIAPWLVGVTLLPLMPEVSGTAAAFTLLAAQLLITLSWWWITQPTEGRGGFSGPGVSIGLALFLALTGLEYFTYDYAFVRNVPEPFGTALRSLRGLGLVVVLLSVLFVNLPVILARKRLAWRGGRFLESAAIFVFVILIGALAASLTTPLIITPPVRADRLRIVTLNLHGGYSLYFDSNLADLALQISNNGADVVLLQEVEAGRLVSSGIDQAAWLGRQLHMQVVFFPTNESLQGLAILSRLPIEAQQGVFLTSIGKQTGVQYVRLRAQDRAVLDVYNTELGYLIKDSTQSVDVQEKDQLAQRDQIFGLINQNDPTLTTRTVIGGSFNNTPGSDLYQSMAQSFLDPLVGLAEEKAITWRLVNNVTSRVDYLWLRRVTPLQVGVAPLTSSTHNMAVLEIGLLPTPG